MTNAPDVILDLRERPRLATTDSLYRMSVSDSASSEPVAEVASEPPKKIPLKIPTSYINPIIHSNVISKINANIKYSMSSKSSCSTKTGTSGSTKTAISVKRDKVIETKIENFDINESFPDCKPIQENPDVVPTNKNTSNLDSTESKNL